MLPLAPSASKLPWAVENLRFCPWCEQLAQKDLNDCPTCGRRMGPLTRRRERECGRARRRRVVACLRRWRLTRMRRQQRLGRGPQEHARTSRRRRTRAPKRRRCRRPPPRARRPRRPARPAKARPPPRRKRRESSEESSSGKGSSQRSARARAAPPPKQKKNQPPKRRQRRKRTRDRLQPHRRRQRPASRPAWRSGSGDQRGAVGQARGLVEAVVLHRRADLGVGRSGRWCWCTGSCGRLARQEVSLPKPSASAGAQVGTVSAITSPFFTGIVVSSGNWAVLPK